MGWIKCEDSLPQNCKTVLVWYEYYSLWGKTAGYGLSWYSEHKGWYEGNLEGEDRKVIYWTPLPGTPTDYP